MQFWHPGLSAHPLWAKEIDVACSENGWILLMVDRHHARGADEHVMNKIDDEAELVECITSGWTCLQGLLDIPSWSAVRNRPNNSSRASVVSDRGKSEGGKPMFLSIQQMSHQCRDL